MSKKLRPRRGAEDAAVQEDILLEEGEVFFEFPEGKAEGFTPGRIMIGNGNSRYNEKTNATTMNEFQPFITDPQIYTPIFEDDVPKDGDHYKYDDTDRGYTKLKNLIMGARQLPDFIGVFKSVLCRHTDNLRYDDYRLKQLEAKVLKTDILDMKVLSVQVSPDSYQKSMPIYAEDIPDGYDFFRWEQLAVPGGSTDNISRIGVVQNVLARNTTLIALNENLLYDVLYTCYYTVVKRNKTVQ